MLSYYPILKETHNFHLKELDIIQMFNSNYTDYYERLQPPFDVDLEDRLKGRHNYSINLSGYLKARKRSEEWKSKIFPLTVAENKELLAQYLKMCNSYNVVPIVVVFPVSDIYRRWFPQRLLEEFYYIIGQLKKSDKFVFWDYFSSNLFQHTDFYDVDHLNIEGSKKISGLINSAILEMERCGIS